MKIILAGGSGQIGQILARHFSGSGDEVVVLTRGAAAVGRVVRWDGRTAGDWFGEIDGADVVINLAGRSVNCRYNARNRAEIIDSRVASTRIVAEAIAVASRPPRLWLQSSTATIYAHRFDAANDEDGILGGAEPNLPFTWRFSLDVARRWEEALDAVPTPATRKVILRSAMVMSPDHGGVFDTLLRLVRFGLGGRAGNGRQFMSWIHDFDFIAAIRWLIEHEEVDGVVNVASPNPLPNSHFMRELRRAWGIAFGLPATRWMLELGAFALRSETELILKSRRVVPGRLLADGFTFRFADWSTAASDLCARWRSAAVAR